MGEEVQMSDGLSDANRGDKWCDEGHVLSVAISEGAEIIGWRCFCGAVRWKPSDPSPSSSHEPEGTKSQ